MGWGEGRGNRLGGEGVVNGGLGGGRGCRGGLWGVGHVGVVGKSRGRWVVCGGVSGGVGRMWGWG